MSRSGYSTKWRVLWQDWRDHHDWVGRRRLPKHLRRVRPPIRHARNFPSREAAENFVAELRRQVPEDELVTQIVSLPVSAKVAPKEQLLPGDWPLQRRDGGALS